MNEIERRIVNLELVQFGKSGNFWHGTDKLSDNVLTGNLGAMTHIIDPITKTPLSKGYHYIKVLIPNQRYLGKTGAHEEEFDLDTSHRQIEE